VKILLINANPVVSRLFALCTRDEHIQLDEAEDIKEAETGKGYDLLFVDDASYSDVVREFMESRPAIAKKVFISYDHGTNSGFDMTLRKPFLPSQILEIIESASVREEMPKIEEETVIFPLQNQEEEKSAETEADRKFEIPSIFPLASEEVEEELVEEAEEEILPENPHILDSREIEKIKGLLDMEEEEEVLPVEEELPEEVVEQRKVEAIKAQLIADGLEIVEEEEIVGVLESGKKSKKKKKSAKRGPFSKEEFEAVEKAFTEALFKLKPKKIKKLLKGKKVKLTLQLKDQK